MIWPFQKEIDSIEVPTFELEQIKVPASALQVGMKIGRLTITGFEDKIVGTGARGPRRSKYATTICQCGKTKTVRAESIAQGLARSCGCSKGVRTSDSSINSIRHVMTYTLSSAKKRGLSIELTLEQVRALIFRSCDYCGKHPEARIAKGNSRQLAPFNGIDRIDSSRGYSIDNCVTACTACNTSKLDMTLDEFKAHVARINAKINVPQDESRAVRLTPKTWKYYDGSVILSDYMGSDLSVVNAARVSFGSQKSALDEKDIKLIHYLAKHKHMSPFRHVQISIILQDIPEFVLRQLYKHQVGMAYTSGDFRESATVWNEVSGRYVEFDFKFFEPVSFRPQHENNKQSSYHDRSVPNEPEVRALYKESVASSYASYHKLLELGVAKEQARLVIPLCFNTSVIWTGSLESFVHFVKLRDHEGAQLEIRTLAKIVWEITKEIAPVSVAALLPTD